jgi:hypothetical protein
VIDADGAGSKLGRTGHLPPQPVDSIAQHQDLSPHILLCPTFCYADERQIWTIHRGKGASWQAHGLDGKLVIGREVLDDIDTGI